MRIALPSLFFALLASLGASCSSAAYGELRWTASGPGGGGAFAGAAISAKGNHVLVASDLGGIYRSTTGGRSWHAIGSRQGLMTTHVDAVIFDPAMAGHAFAGGQGGIYRSTTCSSDGDCRFDRQDVPAVTDATLVTALAASGQQTLYAAGIDGWCDDGAHVWTSADNGTSWREVAAQGLPDAVNVMAIRIAPDDAKTLIAISARSRFTGCGEETAYPVQAPNRAYVSRDGGETFVPVIIAPSAPELAQADEASGESWAYVEDVKFDGADPRRIWATVTANPDGAQHWRVDGELWSGRLDGALSLQSSSHTGQLWPLTTGSVRTIDLRRQYPWDRDQTGVWEFHAADKRWQRLTTDAAYLNWDRGWVSDPGQRGQDNAPGLAIGMGQSLNGSLHTITPVDDMNLWWTTSQFVYGTADGGRLFAQQFTDFKNRAFQSRGIDNAVPAVIVPGADDGDTLYAGYLDMGCWHSANGLSAVPSWMSCNGPASVGPEYPVSPWNGDWKGYGGDTTALAADAAVAGRVWMVQSDTSAVKGLYRIAVSPDSGANLADMTFDLHSARKADGAAITDLALDGEGRPWLAANNRLFVLDAKRKSWRAVVTGCEGGLMVLAVKDRHILAGGGDGVCASLDGGVTWTRWTPPWTNSGASTWWHDGQMVGGAWVRYQGVTDFALHPNDAMTAWMTVMIPSVANTEPDAGLYKTDDGGKSWHKIDMPDRAARGLNFARTVAVSPARPDVLAVGTSTALTSGGLLQPHDDTGVWVSRDGGRSWSSSPENDGLAYPFMTRLRFAAGAEPRLWGISPGQGLVFSAGP